MKLRSLLVGVLSVVCLVGVPATALADGKLDFSLGGTGSMTLDPVPDYEESAQDVAVDNLGRIIVVETGRYAPTGYRAGFVLRYLPNGTLDTSFSAGDDLYPDGVKDVAQATDVDLDSVAIDSQGRIVVGGWYTTPGDDTDLWLARLTPDGQYDSTFGNLGGAISQDLGGREYLNDLAIDSEDQIFVAASRQPISEALQGVVAKFNTDGSFFGWTDPFDNPDEPTGIGGIAIDSKDRAVLAAGWHDFEQVAAIRLTVDGIRDLSFGDAGIATFNVDPRNTVSEMGDNVMIDSKGRINLTGNAVGGDSDSGRAQDPNDIVVARLLPNGKPDKSFSGDGLNVHTVTGGDIGGGPATLDRAGRIVTTDIVRTAVTARSNGARRGFPLSDISSLITRFRADGSLDKSFGNKGEIRVSKPEKKIQFNAVTTDPKGRYVIAGAESDSDNNSQILLTRYLAKYPVTLKLKFGKVKLNRKKGTAVLPVTATAAARITLTGKNLKKKTVTAKKGKTVKIAVIARGKLKRALLKRGKAVAKLKLTAKPLAGGKAVSKRVKVTLKRK